MAFTGTLAFLTVLLVLLPTISLGDFLTPLLAPILDDVCTEVECGKGTCKPSLNSTFFFECECDRGWKQSRPDHSDHLSFLPCVIPNCSLDYSCSAAAPAPVQEKGIQANKSIFDVCHWSYCGGGSCNRTSEFGHTCECQEGYYNLLNVTALPCFRDCAIGMDCSSLGISGSNKSTPLSTPNSSDSGKNQASSILRWKFYLLIVFIMSLAAA